MSLEPYVIYPGVTGANLVGFTGSVGDGATPGRFSLTLHRSAELAATGTLVFGDNERECVVPNCRVVDARVAGPLFEVVLEDRRWRWQFGGAYGRYNVPDGGVRKSAQELVDLLWLELRETGLDTSLFVRNNFPEVEWDGENPAEALVAILDELGYTLAPSLSGSWKVWPQGTGDIYTAAGYDIAPSLTQPIIAAPDAIRAFSGPIQYEAVFALEAVGEDTSGVIRPIDDLSYTPAWGWAKEGDDMAGIEGTYTRGGQTLNLRDLARSCVRRWYQVASMPSGTGAESFNPPGYPPTAPPVEFWNAGGYIISSARLLPVCNSPGGNKSYGYRADAEVWGVYEQDELTGANTRPGTRVKESFSFDADKAIVRFGKPMRQNNDDLDEILPAELYIRCAMEIDTPETGYPLSYQVTVPTGLNNGTGPEPLAKPKLQIRYQPVWNSDGTANAPAAGQDYPSDTQDIAQQLQTAAMERLQAYQAQTGGTQTFVGFHDPQINGRVTNVSWSYNVGSAAMTTIGVGTSASKFIRPNRRKERYEYRGARSAFSLKQDRQSRLAARGLRT
ncbi:hypothetical protein [Botrimarina mediterranea]|uniref:hypothetical protein n=1 Tax=Botrimarina mediterranea TaxID=2528022 RepID=UPI00118C0932|nr:hypothetical protein K2D_16980 [Planctomycetes bacterium K2D]